MTIDSNDNYGGRPDYGDTGTRGYQGTGSDDDRGGNIKTDETGRLISADKVQGTAVYNAEAERIGTIDSIMIDKVSGEVAYAVMSFGGFLGIGERYHPLPWDELTYDTAQGGYSVGLSRSQLEGGPSYSRDELSSFDDDRGSEIDDYYGDEGAAGSDRNWSNRDASAGMTAGSAAGAGQSSTMPSSGMGVGGSRGGTTPDMGGTTTGGSTGSGTGTGSPGDAGQGTGTKAY